MIKKQVRYNIEINPQESEFSTHKWIFMIIDLEHEIKTIEREIYSQFERIVEPKILYVGVADSSKYLYSKFFSFLTSIGKIEQPNKIHSVLTLDKNLTEGDDVSFEKFLREIKSKSRK